MSYVKLILKAAFTISVTILCTHREWAIQNLIGYNLYNCLFKISSNCLYKITSMKIAKVCIWPNRPYSLGGILVTDHLMCKCPKKYVGIGWAVDEIKDDGILMTADRDCGRPEILLGDLRWTCTLPHGHK